MLWIENEGAFHELVSGTKVAFFSTGTDKVRVCFGPDQQFHVSMEQGRAISDLIRGQMRVQQAATMRADEDMEYYRLHREAIKDLNLKG